MTSHRARGMPGMRRHQSPYQKMATGLRTRAEYKNKHPRNRIVREFLRARHSTVAWGNILNKKKVKTYPVLASTRNRKQKNGQVSEIRRDSALPKRDLVTISEKLARKWQTADICDFLESITVFEFVPQHAFTYTCHFFRAARSSFHWFINNLSYVN